MAGLKSMTLNSITTEINRMNSVKLQIEKYLQKKPMTIEEIIFTKYIELQNASAVADFMNDKGYRIKTDSRHEERRYISNDITQLFNKPFSHLYGGQYLYDFAKTIYLYYKG